MEGAQHAKPSDIKALGQISTTVLPIALLWYAIHLSASVSYWLTAAVTALLCLMLLRAFVLMHECGHHSVFRSTRLNKACAFAFGVMVGMPQQVWAKNHQNHHATNGNWAR
jgi:omega-6 fatty acid desaturase (delta-12 desaturase)